MQKFCTGKGGGRTWDIKKRGAVAACSVRGALEYNI